MGLDDRKTKILRAIIHSYITSAEPIGSRTISKKYDLGVSSATIRNEMSDLEDLGYLTQPHTSAGRIPSDKAYRLYVNQLLLGRNFTLGNKEIIKKSLLDEIGEMEQVLQNAAKILSNITNYTSLVIAPQINQSKLKHIQLIPVDESKVLVVIVTESGVVKNSILRFNNNFTYDDLSKISNLLNDKLRGKIIGKIGNDIIESLVEEMFLYRNMLNNIIPVINKSVEDINTNNLYSDGITNIFNFPEYNDIAKAKSFLSFIEDKNSVFQMLLNSGFKEIEIKIGTENNYEEIKECSLITATYSFKGKTIGKIGVIGPTRMDYSKVISVVKSIATNLSDIIENDKYNNK